jgi:hypothetical protein
MTKAPLVSGRAERRPEKTGIPTELLLYINNNEFDSRDLFPLLKRKQVDYFDN